VLEAVAAPNAGVVAIVASDVATHIHKKRNVHVTARRPQASIVCSILVGDLAPKLNFGIDVTDAVVALVVAPAVVPVTVTANA
jgi:hypothetical protein